MPQEWTEVITIQHYKIAKLFHISYLLLLSAKKENSLASSSDSERSIRFILPAQERAM